MDQFLASLPKSLIAISAMVIALFVIRQVQPPHTVCHSQMELFRDLQKRFLYAKAKATDTGRLIDVKTLFEDCSNQIGPGGCFEYFSFMKKVVVDLNNIPEHCAEAVVAEPELQQWLWKTMKLMVLMAWGDRAPASYVQRNGWYDASDLTLFCGMRRQAIRFFGQETYSTWQESILKSMPKAEVLSREEVWQRSVLSTACDLYK